MKRALVFDSQDWEMAGSDQGDNQCFWKSATVLRRYRSTSTSQKRSDVLVDVKFDYGRESKGHFEYAIKYFEDLDQQFRVENMIEGGGS